MRRDYPVVLGTLYLFTLIGLVVKLIVATCSTWSSTRACSSGRWRSERGTPRSSAPTPRRRPPAPRRDASLSPNQRAWARFQRNRLGYVSLWIFAGAAGRGAPSPSCSATTGRSSRATTGEWYFPVVQQPARDRASAATSRRRPTGTIRSSPSSSPSPATGRCSRSTRTRRTLARLLRASSPTRRRRARRNWLGTDEPGRDMMARLLYGFRVSIWFALALTVDRHGARHRRRRAAGLLRRPRRPRRCSASSRSGARCPSSTC